MTRVTTTSRTHPSCASRAPSSTTALMKELQAGKSPSRMIKELWSALRRPMQTALTRSATTPGDHTVFEEAKDGWAAVGATSLPVTLECDDSSDNDFTNTPLLCIEGTKLNDCTDEGIAGWEITLKDDQEELWSALRRPMQTALTRSATSTVTTQSSKRQKTAGRLLERPHSR